MIIPQPSLTDALTYYIGLARVANRSFVDCNWIRYARVIRHMDRVKRYIDDVNLWDGITF